MKKIIATLSLVIVAFAGAEAQSTVTFPNSGTTSFTALTINSSSITPANPFTTARVLIGASGVPSGTSITFSNITLSGQGIDTTFSFGPYTANSGNNITDPSNVFAYLGLGSTVTLNSSVSTWNSSVNRLSFDSSITGPLPAGSQIYYAVMYSIGGSQLNTEFQNINLVAVPEPSTYFAAAGLLGLCLWSSRRHLFKFAGSRSTSSGSGSNGAA